MSRPRVLIEDWLPAAAIGVECIRERSTGQQPPDKRLHVWWARRPLTVSRAAVLGSLLPADFPKNVFERLLGFGRSGNEIVEVRRLMDMGYEVPGGFCCDRAFKRSLRFDDLDLAHDAASRLWGDGISVIDPMAGGGSIPLEAVRLGFRAFANEYNPVAWSILEATVDYPFRFGDKLGQQTRRWAKVWQERVEERLTRAIIQWEAENALTKETVEVAVWSERWENREECIQAEAEHYIAEKTCRLTLSQGLPSLATPVKLRGALTSTWSGSRI